MFYLVPMREIIGQNRFFGLGKGYRKRINNFFTVLLGN